MIIMEFSALNLQVLRQTGGWVQAMNCRPSFFVTENRAGSITGDFFRGTAFHAVYQPLVSVTAHDDQVACFLFGGIDDF